MTPLCTCLRIAFALALGGVLACASAPRAASEKTEKTQVEIEHAPPLQITRVRQPENVLDRAELNRMLQEGIGRFLQRVRTQPARDRSGHFVGYRITALFPGEDISPQCPRIGDIVQTVNGAPIIRPDQLYDLWQTLASVNQIDIHVLRDARAVICQFHVVGAPAPASIDENDWDSEPAP